MRLIEQVADARTPADALRLLRDWLEGKGEHAAGALLHEETFLDLALYGPTEWYEVSEAKQTLDDVERGEIRAAAYDQGHEEGYEEGFAAGRVTLATVEASDAD